MFVFLGFGYLNKNFFSSYIHVSAKFILSLYFFPWVVLHCLSVPIFLIHSSVEGHIGCFQVVAITNNVTMNILSKCPCGMVVYPLGIFPGIPRVVFLCLGVDWLPIFWEATILIYKVLYKLKLPPAVNECSPYFTSSQTQSVIRVYDLKHSDRCKMVS